MSSHCATRDNSRVGRLSKRKVTPLFVCPGAKEVAVNQAGTHLVAGFSIMSRCPARDTCLWYAGHDLGGSDAFNEFPEAALLPGRFSTRPFSCSDFKLQGREVAGTGRVRKHRGQTSALILLLHMVAVFAVSLLHCSGQTSATPGKLPMVLRPLAGRRHPKR